MVAILKGSSQRGWKTTTSTVNDPSACSLHSPSKESQNSSFPALRICWPIVTDTASLTTSEMSRISGMTAQLEFRPLRADLGVQFRLLDGSIWYKGRWGSI